MTSAHQSYSPFFRGGFQSGSNASAAKIPNVLIPVLPGWFPKPVAAARAISVGVLIPVLPGWFPKRLERVEADSVRVLIPVLPGWFPKLVAEHIWRAAQALNPRSSGVVSKARGTDTKSSV